ncbi:MAG TPA: ABC transporter permease subunit [Burkholderiales bacterium]|jgi:NitT/TauT family transport system permease protein|nr:ABC transporter permease subunit [Burkholderiales bacterium]
MAIRKEAFIAAGGVVVVWQIAAFFFPPFLFPPVPAIFRQFLDIFTKGSQVSSALATFARILAGMAGAFVVGGLVAIAMGASKKVTRYCYPLLNFNQGIPALSWVVISIIWFKNTEFRIWFIIVMTTLPAFTFQIYDAYRAISKDLLEMSLSFHPNRVDLFRTLIWPGVVPGIVTAWKVNIGNVSRVVVVAELVGATNGVGYELLERQQLFDMAGAIAWTLVLVAFVVISQHAITLVERRVLRYRPESERSS